VIGRRPERYCCGNVSDNCSTAVSAVISAVIQPFSEPFQSIDRISKKSEAANSGGAAIPRLGSAA
jgi:hypothetical protein